MNNKIGKNSSKRNTNVKISQVFIKNPANRRYVISVSLFIKILVWGVVGGKILILVCDKILCWGWLGCDKIKSWGWLGCNKISSCCWLGCDRILSWGWLGCDKISSWGWLDCDKILSWGWLGCNKISSWGWLGQVSIWTMFNNCW